MPVNKKPTKKLTAKASKTEAPPSDEIVLDDAELAKDDAAQQPPISQSQQPSSSGSFEDRLKDLEKDAKYVKKSDFWKTAIGIGVSITGLLFLGYCNISTKIDALNDKIIGVDKRVMLIEHDSIKQNKKPTK